MLHTYCQYKGGVLFLENKKSAGKNKFALFSHDFVYNLPKTCIFISIFQPSQQYQLVLLVLSRFNGAKQNYLL